jgi:hypothetical protein
LGLAEGNSAKIVRSKELESAKRDAVKPRHAFEDIDKRLNGNEHRPMVLHDAKNSVEPSKNKAAKSNWLKFA